MVALHDVQYVGVERIDEEMPVLAGGEVAKSSSGISGAKRLRDIICAFSL